MSAITADAIVRSARGMVGTPFHHLGRTPGPSGAIDCVGLLACVGKEIGGSVVDEPIYPKETDGSVLMRCLSSCCEMLETKRPMRGDIVVFKRGRATWHACIVSKLAPLTMIHAWGRYTRGAVREEPLSPRWSRSIHSVWRYKEA